MTWDCCEHCMHRRPYVHTMPCLDCVEAGITKRQAEGQPA